MIVCVLIPRFSLLGALGDGRRPLEEQLALAPEPGGVQRIGEVSPAAEAVGVVAGMGIGEALARCPQLSLVPPDPEGVRALWGDLLDALERIGAEVESDRPGTAWFEADGLRRIHGGRTTDVLKAARRALRAERFGSARIGAAPSRFASYAVALRSRPRRPIEPMGEKAVAAFLSGLPVGLLRTRPELAALPDALERLGIRTLGEYAELPAGAVAERFGHPGLLALDLAQGRDTPLQPRRPIEPLLERIDLPEPSSGVQLDRALGLLIARLLARPERRGRTLRALILTGRFVEGGTWRSSATLRRASAESERIELALRPRLAELPAPVESLALGAEGFGPPAHEQPRLIESEDPMAARRARLAEAVHQARSAAGEDAALRVLEVDPDSRVPERRAVLAPYPVERT